MKLGIRKYLRNSVKALIETTVEVLAHFWVRNSVHFFINLHLNLEYKEHT